MAIGMTYEQYWYGDTAMVRAFYQAEKIRRKKEDELAWQTGLYMVKALETTVGNMFRKEGTQAVRYPELPLLQQVEEENKRQNTEEQEEKDLLFAQAYMMNMVQFGKSWGKGK